MKPIWVDKIEVCKRQIVEAIKLFFEARDPIIIHTIIASAHQILVDIGTKQGISGAIKNSDGLTRRQFKHYLQAVNTPYNFFKHANNDPNEKLNVAPINRFSSDFILDAIVIFQRLTNDLPLEAKVFWTWFVGKYSDEFEDCPNDGAIKNMIDMDLAKWDFPTICQFLKFGETIEEVDILD